jgi:hypothetical protein
MVTAIRRCVRATQHVPAPSAAFVTSASSAKTFSNGRLFRVSFLVPRMLALAQYQRLYSRRRCRDRDLAMAGELYGQTCAIRQGLQALQQLEPARVGLLRRWFVVKGSMVEPPDLVTP